MYPSVSIWLLLNKIFLSWILLISVSSDLECLQIYDKLKAYLLVNLDKIFKSSCFLVLSIFFAFWIIFLYGLLTIFSYLGDQFFTHNSPCDPCINYRKYRLLWYYLVFFFGGGGGVGVGVERGREVSIVCVNLLYIVGFIS